MWTRRITHQEHFPQDLQQARRLLCSRPRLQRDTRQRGSLPVGAEPASRVAFRPHTLRHLRHQARLRHPARPLPRLRDSQRYTQRAGKADAQPAPHTTGTVLTFENCFG